MRYALIALLLAGCATAPPPVPKIVIQRVEVAVPVACIKQSPAKPDFPDTKEALSAPPFPGAELRMKANPNDAEARNQVGANLVYRVKLLMAGRILREPYVAQLEAIAEACKT